MDDWRKVLEEWQRQKQLKDDIALEKRFEKHRREREREQRKRREKAARELAAYRRKYHCYIRGCQYGTPGPTIHTHYRYNSSGMNSGGGMRPYEEKAYDEPRGLEKCSKCHRFVCANHRASFSSSYICMNCAKKLRV